MLDKCPAVVLVFDKCSAVVQLQYMVTYDRKYQEFDQLLDK
jgi:hypothetical protein